MFTETLLIIMVFLPLVGAAIIGALSYGNRKWSKRIGLFTSLATFAISIVVYLQYLGIVNAGEGYSDGYVMYFDFDWLTQSALDINFTFAVDGISIYLILLTTLIFPLAIYFSWGSVDRHPRAYYSLLLLLQVGVLGFFVSLDMILFYVFFEMVLIPMYFLIGIWGGKNRVYASMKFFLYTLVGSLLMLVSILYLGTHVNFEALAQLPEFANKTGIENLYFTSDYRLLLANANLPAELQTMTIPVQHLLFWGFAISFAVKVPLFPLHTWLPDAHVQAPTAGSVILAGVLLKMGAYGLIRFCLPLFPISSLYFAPVMCILAVVGVVYGAMAAMVQTDIKKLVAYSSVSHLGFIVLGIFAFTQESMDGAVIQMVNHGVTTGALFLLVGMIYDRRHTRQISDFQGIAEVMPRFTVLFLITVMASIGLPGLNGFVGEFTILVGSFSSPVISVAFPIIAATGVIIAAVYLLWMFRRVMYGKLDKEENRKLVDLNRREMWVMAPLIALMFIMGVYPQPVFRQIEPASEIVVNAVMDHYDPEIKNTAEVAPEPLPTSPEDLAIEDGAAEATNSTESATATVSEELQTESPE
ncbi:NADH-quinone oxidoreductase subunit M [Pontibacter sp. G13]|uniref:complex I subunit 4 family protein n=1 Tax=Pontibacter sp. G13 TaxID=3074898 RepID=UPI00288C18C4|nr:NADH-quinone oxidoreductase subunit M [Pontibacter sp. G13]WNJ16296.1 NADH-quinone oxidoreductase subunit M [Pontibacter sp. G13]